MRELQCEWNECRWWFELDDSDAVGDDVRCSKCGHKQPVGRDRLREQDTGEQDAALPPRGSAPVGGDEWISGRIRRAIAADDDGGRRYRAVIEGEAEI